MLKTTRQARAPTRAGGGSDRWEPDRSAGSRTGPLGAGPGGSGRVDAQSLAHAADMAGGLDVVLGELDLAFGIDDDRRADDALDDLAVVLLLAEGTPFFHHRLVLIEIGRASCRGSGC